MAVHQRMQMLRNVTLVALAFFGLFVCREAPAKAETAKQYMARCPKYIDESNCLDTISEAYLFANACGVELGSSPATVTSAVVQWLHAHPETNNMQSNKGVIKALEALYPCEPNSD
jgi:Rap1a immunity proteins